MLFVDLSKAMSTLLTCSVDEPVLQFENPLVFRMSVPSTDGSRAREANATTDALHMVKRVCCVSNDAWKSRPSDGLQVFSVRLHQSFVHQPQERA